MIWIWMGVIMVAENHLETSPEVDCQNEQRDYPSEMSSWMLQKLLSETP